MIDIISDELLIAKDSSFQMKTNYDGLDSNNLNYNIDHLFEELKISYPDIIEEIQSEEFHLDGTNNIIMDITEENKGSLFEQKLKNELKVKNINTELLQKEQKIDMMTLQLYETLDNIINFCIKHEKILYS